MPIPREPTRRDVLKAAAATAGIAAASSSSAGDERPHPSTAPTTSPSPTFYYVDGYHGGIDGHMPPSSLRNVLDGLDKIPHWKVSFEIEPYSWAVFAKTDPASIDRLKHFLSDPTPQARIELVSGAYGQAYMWNASGESNIRQIAYGLAELRAIFPGVVVDTYAVQEPCWTSCLPQILKSFGYRRAVLKNSTCWGGYHAPTLDADLMHWVAPDGTAIIAVPRYAVEQLISPATMAGAQPTAAFVDRCEQDGIAHPSGTILQDMGWPGRPWRMGMTQDVIHASRHVTWREYADTIASPPQKTWQASQEDLRVGLPWGGAVLQRIAQLVRASEHRLVQAEKIAAMAFVRRGRPFPTDDLHQPWKDLLWSQHHDVWIVSYNRHKDGTWASAAEAKAESINRACAQIVSASTEAMAAARPDADSFVRIFNTTGSRRRDLAAIEVPAGKAVRVLDVQGHEIPTQAAGPTTLLIPAEVPALGYATYQLADRPSGPSLAASGLAKATKTDRAIIIETDALSLSLDPSRGGRITSLFAKDLRREFVDDAGPRSFNEYRGYFPTPGKWLSSTDAPADISIVEDGPLRVAAEVRGHIGPWPFVTRITVALGQRRIDFHTTFDFPLDQHDRFRLGEPWEPKQDTVRSNRRPFYDSSFKLQALFPAKLQQPTLDKNAPFDVCRAAHADTRFNAWDAIRNNVIFNWVDLLDESGHAGLAVMTDHLTAYSLSPGEPLGLVMSYAGRGIWHDYGMSRTPSVSYAVIPHAGDWAAARLWQELARWSEPLVAAACAEPPAGDDERWSLLDATDTGFEATTVFADGGDLLVRLFNAEGDAAPRPIVLDQRVRRVRLVELDGRQIEELPVGRAPGGAATVTVAMPRFAVRTLRCELA